VNAADSACRTERPAAQVSGGLVSALFRRGLWARLGRIEQGRLNVIEGDRVYTFGNEAGGIEVSVRIDHPQFYRLVALRGSVGAGEAYMEGYWSCDRLPDLIRIFARNRHLLDAIEGGLSRFQQWLLSLEHLRRRNTPQGSRRNVREHYDLGNDFFALFLDPLLMYSAAWFESESTSLEEASVAKIERICRKLELNPADHLVEIGSGWGGFAVHAAARYGCRVTTTTVSEEQFRLASERVRRAGLEGQVTVLLEDYRELCGCFDKLVSIEMIEAVGYDFLETYFRCCDSLLRPGGLALIQAITIADEHLEEAMTSVDFIKRYIFPGSALPALKQIRSLTAESTSLRLVDQEDLTEHYAQTLRCWRDRFRAARPKVRELGYSERFIRMWDYYLGYCEGGFLERRIGDYQLLFRKEGV
jgi:cyclopropane-fatty-acyl-phospholipid synthase